MYALANGIYHMKKDKKVAMNYLRIDEKEHDELINFIDSEEAFLYKLVDLDIVQRRNKEAQKAIKKLNFLTWKIHEYKEEDDLTMTTESLKN